MKSIILPMAELKPALTGLGKIINRHSALPVLKQIKIERTPDGWIALSATDLERFVTVRLEQPAPGDPVALLVPFEELARYAKQYGKDQSIALEPADPTSVIISHQLGAQTAQHRISTLPLGEFPQTPLIKSNPIPVPEPLRLILHQALQCASDDSMRAVLQGAFIDTSKPKAHYVIGTDGRHLFSANSWNLPLKKSVIIPKHKFLGWSEFNRDGEWQLRVTEDAGARFVQLNSRRWRFISKEFQGNYPNWRQSIPDPSGEKTKLSLDPTTLEALAQIIGRLPCDNETDQPIRIEWKNHQLSVQGRAPEAADWTKVPVPKVKGEGPDITVKLSRRFFLKALEFGLNSLGIIDEISPLRFSHGSRQMIVMPLRSGDQARHQPPPPQRLPGTNSAVPAAAPRAGTAAPTTTPVPTRRLPRPVPVTTPKIDDALKHVNTLRDSFRSGLSHLRDLCSKLRIIKVSHKAGEKEMQNVRTQIRKIQDVRL